MNANDNKKQKNTNYKLTDYTHESKKSLIAYFDILGYKEMIKTNYIPENILIGEIERITHDVYSIKRFSKKGKSDWNVYSFSDNFAIVIDCPDEGFVSELRLLIWILTIIQCQFLSLYGILIRGSVVNGMVYIGEKFIYGEGLIKAYEIENSIAIFPRIVIDSELIKDCLQDIKSMFQKPVSLYGQIYNPESINEYNMLQLFPRLVFGLIYDSGEVDTKKIDRWLNDEKDDDLIVICKDFDNEYFIDFFQYFIFLERYPNDFDDEDSTNIEESIVDLYVQGFVFYISRYISTFGMDNKMLKKYLWICSKANISLNKVGYHNLFCKSNILKLCKLNLNNIHTDDDTLKMFIQEIPDAEYED
ncbi:MAG: hypothetical protein NC489_41690 [Ruminococcus flavefaciens]|nr:hypothetical protein [Ruminococcus flavefaciens]